MTTTDQLERTEALKRRVPRIEQVLPTLATKEDLKHTENRLRAEIGSAEQRMCTHFDVVTDSLRDDVRLVAEAVATLAQRDR